MILIADSGSSKTLWVFRQNGMDVLVKVTRGLNPNYVPEYVIEKTIQELFKESGLAPRIRNVFFYGSGCGSKAGKTEIQSILRSFLPKAKISVETDMLGAAIGMSNGKPGLVCILGTGSNACLTNGKKITGTVPSGGYIFGDNGSGAQIGKFIIQHYLDGTLPASLKRKLEAEYKINREIIIKKIYREEAPNRYLASFAPFAGNNRKNKFMQQLLQASFSLFFEKQVGQLPGSKKKLIHFTGSVSVAFEQEIRHAAAAHGYTCGAFMQSPMAGLVNHHQ